MSKRLVVYLVFALMITSGCTNDTQSNSPINKQTPPALSQTQPVKDCAYFQDLAYDIQANVEIGHTKIIMDDLIGQWTYVIMNNSKCFTQIEYCDAIDAHNSVSPWGRQESSPYC